MPATKPRLLLTDAAWLKIAPYIAGRKTDCGRTGRNNRLFVEAVGWILRTGAPWRDLPGCFGKWNTIYQRFRRWSKRGVWARLEKCVRTFERTRRVPVVCIDSTIVRAHQHAAGGRGGPRRQRIGRSRGGRTTKIHVAVTVDGIMQSYSVTAGQCADVKFGERLLGCISRHTFLIGDKAYDSDNFIELVEKRGGLPIIPPRCNRRFLRSYNLGLYRLRNCVERYFAKLKHYRRMATRFDKTVRSFRSMFLWANSLMRLRNLRSVGELSCA